MKIALEKSLQDGEYCVIPILTEFTDDDSKKAQKFGYPKLEILIQKNVFKSSLTLEEVAVNELRAVTHRGSSSATEAEAYMKKLAKQIHAVILRWNNLVDTWSGPVDINSLNDEIDF